MTSLLYVWKSPRPADAAEAAALVAAWRAADPDGSAADRSGFEPSEDVRWFHRELTGDVPPLWNPDAPAKVDNHPSHVVAVPFSPEMAQEAVESVLGLAAKYDLVVYDPQREMVHTPLAEMAAYASATFWPRGAIRAAVAGGAGLLIAIGAYLVGIPIVSGIAIVVGAFLFVMAVGTFIHEARVRMGSGSGGRTPET